MSNVLNSKRRRPLSITILFIVVVQLGAFSQHSGNSGFELLDPQHKRPVGWNLSGGSKTGFTFTADSLIKYKGTYSVCIARDTSATVSETGEITFTIPSIYEGATIKLIGFIRTEGISADGSAGLFIRTEGTSGIIEQNNMADKRILGTNPWKKYSVEVSLYDYVKKIVVGGWMKGTKGRVWFDELNVYIEGRELERTTIYGARLDSSYAQGSGIQIAKLDKSELRNLQLLGQLWGFLKYHHPAIASGQRNWDYELFRLLPNYLSASSAKQRDQLLMAWINDLGAISCCKDCKELPDSVVKMKQDWHWKSSRDMNDELRHKIDDIYQNRNQGKQYYASIATGIGNAEFTNEDPYEQFVYPDDGFRLLALYRYWNIIRYFFPYRYAIEEDWNATLIKSIPKFAFARNKLEYRKAVVELIGSVHDTHANLWGRDSVWANYKGKFIAPIQTKFIESKLVVTNYYSDSLARATGLQIGDIVTAIDGVSPENLVKERMVFYPASNYPTQLRDLAKDMLRGNSRYVNIEIKRGRETISQKVRRFSLDSIDTQLDRTYSAPDSCYRFVTAEVGYINLGNIKSSMLPKIFKDFQSTKGIVIDVRNYPSEFVVFSLANYLLSAPSPFVKFATASVNHPGLFSWGTTLSVGYNNKNPYQGKVVILINEITQSQAEYTTMALRTCKNSLVVGSTTAGADGNVSIFYLPGKLRTMISGIGIYYPDGRETQRVGIVPDIVVNPTIAGIAAGRDEALERAIYHIQQL
jgi:C-terminal processing protease CtpA/Prc